MWFCFGLRGWSLLNSVACVPFKKGSVIPAWATPALKHLGLRPRFDPPDARCRSMPMPDVAHATSWNNIGHREENIEDAKPKCLRAGEAQPGMTEPF